MDLDRMALIAGNLIGVAPAEVPGVLARFGASEASWAAACAKLASLGGPESERYRARTREALTARLGGEPEFPFDAFVRANVAARATQDIGAAVRASGLASEAHFYLGSYVWTDRIATDPRVSALFDTGVMVGLARRERPAPPLPPPRAAKRIRALACPRCGAHKRTLPRTAYVYCDYCAYLFDYDERVLAEHVGALPFHATFSRLRDAVADDVRRAWKARDLDAYREAWSWVYEHDIELLPEGWPPRVREPEYRRAIVAFSVAACEVTNEDASIQRASKACEKAWLTAIGKPSAKHLVAYFRASLASLDAQIAAYSAHRLFERYPEQITPDDFRRVNLRMSMRECLANADSSARAAILAAAGVREDAYAEVPAVNLDSCSCGRCGSPLLVAGGANRIVCESCGDVLDARAPRVPCPSCGAPFVAADGRVVSCAHCHARMETL